MVKRSDIVERVKRWKERYEHENDFDIIENLVEDFQASRVYFNQLRKKLYELQKKIDEHKDFGSLFDERYIDFEKECTNLVELSNTQKIFRDIPEEHTSDKSALIDAVSRLRNLLIKIINDYKLVHSTIYNYNKEGIHHYETLFVLIEEFISNQGFVEVSKEKENLKVFQGAMRSSLIELDKFNKVNLPALKTKINEINTRIRINYQNLASDFSKIWEGIVQEILREIGFVEIKGKLLNYQKAINTRRLSILHNLLGENKKIGKYFWEFDNVIIKKDEIGRFFNMRRNLTEHDPFHSKKMIVEFPEINFKDYEHFQKQPGMSTFVFYLNQKFFSKGLSPNRKDSFAGQVHYIGSKEFRHLFTSLHDDLDNRIKVFDTAKNNILIYYFTKNKKKARIQNSLFDVIKYELNYLSKFIQYTLFDYIPEIQKIKQEHRDEFNNIVKNINIKVSEMKTDEQYEAWRKSTQEHSHKKREKIKRKK